MTWKIALAFATLVGGGGGFTTYFTNLTLEKCLIWGVGPGSANGIVVFNLWGRMGQEWGRMGHGIPSYPNPVPSCPANFFSCFANNLVIVY